ncbi:MAG: beta-hydroxyacyl-ACP dehydratase [Puniceicoccales bacterium]|jgi:3-hydroxyacyl-[acyl-carrier-protein] dehydratase|nr:beta-hydroxyacyl-ACP dehydratase [Puniceicoccales bacterium]
MNIAPKNWIPHRAPFLFVDKIISIESQTIVAQKTFDASMDCYRGHYPSNPVTPGVLLCEAMFQTAGILVAFKLKNVHQKGVPVLSRLEEAKFHTMVFPGETVEMKITWEQTMNRFFWFKGKMVCNDKRVLNARFILTHLSHNENVSAGGELRPLAKAVL